MNRSDRAVLDILYRKRPIVRCGGVRQSSFGVEFPHMCFLGLRSLYCEATFSMTTLIAKARLLLPVICQRSALIERISAQAKESSHLSSLIMLVNP